MVENSTLPNITVGLDDSNSSISRQNCPQGGNSGDKCCAGRSPFSVLTKNSRKLPTRLKSVRLRCLDCSERKIDVKNCEFDGKRAELCPIWPWRSGHRVKGRGPGKATCEYCLWCMNDQHNEVIKCPNNGCPLWPYRLTKIRRPEE